MPATETRPEVAHERRDAGVKPVVLFGVWLFAVCVAVAAAMWGFLRLLERRNVTIGEREVAPVVEASLRRRPPEPRLEPLPLLPLARMRAQENQLLNGYGWVDQKSGIVHIPIARAMDLVAQRGLPKFPPGGPPGRDTAAARSVIPAQRQVRR